MQSQKKGELTEDKIRLGRRYAPSANESISSLNWHPSAAVPESKQT